MYWKNNLLLVQNPALYLFLHFQLHEGPKPEHIVEGCNTWFFNDLSKLVNFTFNFEIQCYNNFSLIYLRCLFKEKHTIKICN
jgi:hypothetical protein